MKIPTPAILVVLALSSLPSLGRSEEPSTATIEGRVELPKAARRTVMQQRYEVITNSGVVSIDPPTAVVYLEGSFPKPNELPKAQVVQKDYTFIPAVLPIQVGTRVEFPNEDKAFHNIFSYSPAKRFDLGRYRPDERPIPSEIFDKPGLVTLRCEIHEHMRAIILVLDTPHFVLTGADGTFKMTGLPPGHYKLKAWLNSKTTLEKEVDLSSGSVVRGDFP
ncbi:MAG: carboxypeptidase regulatory-like domain-containing protein [Nibricoccus sp.]